MRHIKSPRAMAVTIPSMSGSSRRHSREVVPRASGRHGHGEAPGGDGGGAHDESGLGRGGVAGLACRCGVAAGSPGPGAGRGARSDPRAERRGAAARVDADGGRCFAEARSEAKRCTRETKGSPISRTRQRLGGSGPTKQVCSQPQNEKQKVRGTRRRRAFVTPSLSPLTPPALDAPSRKGG
jgi:hypothetical protein